MIKIAICDDEAPARAYLSALLGEEETRAETLIADYASHGIVMALPGELES